MRKQDCGLTGLTFTVPSLVRVEFAAECDLKNIIRKFLATGQLPDSRQASDITDATRLPEDFQDLQDSSLRIRQRFEMLPESERLQYGNDPEAWLAAQAEKAAEEPGKEANSEAVTHEPANGESSEEDSQGSSAPAS